MRKITILSSSLLVGLSLIFIGAGLRAEAARPADWSLPEQSGVYDDPLHPGIKVRVFVHRENPARPGGGSSLVCGLADPDSGAVVGSTGWRLPANWTYRLNPASVPASVGGVNLPVMAANAFSDWSVAASGRVIFTRGADTATSRQAYDGENIIAWGRTSGSALGVTYTRYNPATNEVVDVDTIMNNKFAWRWSGSDTCAYTNVYDAENILVHELGHWLGLDDEYDVTYQNHTMYGYGAKGEAKKNTLTQGDVAGTALIYP